MNLIELLRYADNISNPKYTRKAWYGKTPTYLEWGGRHLEYVIGDVKEVHTRYEWVPTFNDFFEDDWELYTETNAEEEGTHIVTFGQLQHYSVVKIEPSEFYTPSSLEFSRTFGKWTERDILRLLAAWKLGIKLTGYNKVEKG